MCSNAILPVHLTDLNYHRRCGIQVQTLLLFHEVITLVVTVAAISIGVILLIFPNIHRKTALYKQFFAHYARTRSSYYMLLYRIACAVWTGTHIIHVITGITSIMAIKLIKPELLYPQLVILVILAGFYIFSFISILTMNFIGSSIIWITLLIIICFLFFTSTNLYFLVLTHRYVTDRQEALQKILRSAKTVTFRDIQSSNKQYEE